MNPTKSERKSRRSSILKPPKPRIPLQNVELDASSNENSPATTKTKVKRRVSFAEKKHVKEFCDSPEQGTVWDNTYEESELGQIKPNQNSKNDENIISDVGERNDPNFICEQISVVTKSVVSIAQSVNTENSKALDGEIILGDSMGGRTHTMSSGILFPSWSFHSQQSLLVKETFTGKNVDTESGSADSCPTNASVVGFVNSNDFSPQTMQDDDCNEVPMEETLTGDVSVELESKLTQTIDNTGILKDNQSRITIYHDSSIEKTETASNETPLIREQLNKVGNKELKEEASLVTVEKTTFQMKTVETVNKILGISGTGFNELKQKEIDLRPERMPIFHHKSSLLGEGSLNVSSAQQLKKLQSERTIPFGNKPTDFTMIVQNVVVPQKTAPERITLFHDKSFELTEAVPRVSSVDQLKKLHSETSMLFHKETVNRTEVFHNKSLDFTEVVGHGLSCKNKQKLTSDKTTILNQSVDMTEVVESDQRYENRPKLPEEKTTIIHNQFVDMTGVVQSGQRYDNLLKLPEDKTKIFHNQSVDMTGVVQCSQKYENPLKLPEEKTTIFHDQSVDMTGVVQSGLRCENPLKFPEEKTTVFHNQSVDMTGVVQSGQKYETPLKNPEDKTTIFHNQSVDMTGVVHYGQRYENPLKLPEEKTTIFHNQSVDMTGVVQSGQRYENPLKLPEDKTTIFHNQSVDMTRVVQSGQRYGNPLKLSEEKTTIFHNQSVDMTGVVQSGQRYENLLKLPEDKTKIFHNQSVDMTEVVQCSQKYENPLKLPEEKTTIFHDQSVDMTGIVESGLRCENPLKFPEEKTTVFHNQSVDMTGVVQSGQLYEHPLKLPEENTKIFHNQSVDMTGVVQCDQKYENPLKLPEEKTTIFHDQSVDMTGVVKSGRNWENPLNLPQDKTTIIHNQSVDMTGVVKGSQNDKILVKFPEEKTTIFHNQSMDTTRMIPSSLSNQNPIHRILEHENLPSKSQDASVSQKTSLSLDNMETENDNKRYVSQSLEMTETISRVPCISKFLSRDSCTLAVERLAKHKPLEFDETNRCIASVEAKNFDPEVRSPVPKRMKSVDGSLSNINLSAKLLIKPVQATRQCAQNKNMNTENTAMEIADANPNCYSLKCSESTNDNSMRQPLGTTMGHDDSMEITRAMPGIIQAKTTTIYGESMERNPEEAYPSSTQILPETNENLDSKVDPRFHTSSIYNSKTIVFREDLMELTRAVQRTSQLSERKSSVLKEGKNPSLNGIVQLEEDEKSMVNRDNSMKISSEVPFSRQSQFDVIDKENCPLGIEGLQSYSSRRSNRRGTEVLKNELLEIMKTVPFSSSQERPSRVERIESEEQRSDIRSEEITGVVPLIEHIGDKSEDLRDLRRVGFDFEIEKMEMTEGVRWSSGVTLEKDKNLCEFPEMEEFSPVTQSRPSHVAKELFQKLGPFRRAKKFTVNLKDHSETPDLDAEIRKLAESFVTSNPVDESGFDQETFLRQQARCMEDYEANSTASQEYPSGSISARKAEPFTEKRVSPDPGVSNNPKDPATNERCALSTASWAVSTNSKTENTLGRNNNISIVENNSIIDRGHYDKSLEELRHRAYSVSKFRPEVTGFELTAAMTTADAGKSHGISMEEPPSFVFADSITNDSVNEITPVNELSIDKEQLQTSKSPVLVPNITETIDLLRNDRSGAPGIMDVVELTMTVDVNDIECTNDWKNEKTLEKSAAKQQRTYVMKRHNTDSIRIDDTKDERLFGVTTATEFSTESPDGPHEKLRRQEIDSTIELNELPTAGIERNATELKTVEHCWKNRKFVNSTVIGDDCTRQFVHSGLQEISIMLETPCSDELPSEIPPNVEETTSPRNDLNKTHETAMELYIPVPESPFVVFKKTIESLATSPKTIWRIKRFDEKIVVFNFFSKTIVLAIYLNDTADSNATISPIKKISLLSQLVEEGTDPGVCLAHSVIMKKVDSASFTNLYQTYEDIPSLLEYVSREVKLGMNFMFDLDRLRNRTIMEFHENRLSFVVRTRDINAGIILKITMDIKPFEQINSNDISVAYIMGRDKVREHDIERLITNVKRDHRFLTFYINDVKDYLDLMAETGYSNRVET